MLSTRTAERRVEVVVLGWAALMLLGLAVLVAALVPSLQAGGDDAVLPDWHRPAAVGLGLVLGGWQLQLAWAALRGRRDVAAEGVRGKYVAASLVMLLATALGALFFSWAAVVVALSAACCLVASLRVPRSGGDAATVLGYAPDPQRAVAPGVTPRTFWTVVGLSLLVAVVGLAVAVALAW